MERHFANTLVEQGEAKLTRKQMGPAKECGGVLIGKNHVLGIAELLQAGVSCLLDQRWWTTDQDERVLRRRRKVPLDHVSSNKA